MADDEKKNMDVSDSDDEEEYETDSDDEAMPDLEGPGTAPEPEPEPEPVIPPLEWKNQGNAHFKAKRYREAIACYTNAVDGEPENPIFLSNRASAHMMVEDFKAGVSDAQQAVLLAPGTVKYMEKMARCFASLGRKSDAQRTYSEILDLDPKNASALREVGELRQVETLRKQAASAAGDGQHNIAISFLGRALDLAPGDDSLKLLQAESCLAVNKIGDAERIAASILRKDSNHTEALYVRGLCMYNMGDTEKALEHFKRALQGDPDHTRSRAKLKMVKLLMRTKAAGTTAFKARKYDEAYTLYTEALAVDPTNRSENSKLYYNRALVLSKMERNEEALSDCDQALSFDPKYTKALTKKVRIQIDLEQFDEAVKNAEEACNMDQSDRELQRLLQEAKLELKKSKRKNYYKILSVNKNCDDRELKKAYRKSALKHHPDRCHDDSKKEEFEAAFKDVNEAYSVLSDKQKRQRYDDGADIEEINSGGGGHGHGHGGMSADMFSQFFGGGGGGFPGGF